MGEFFSRICLAWSLSKYPNLIDYLLCSHTMLHGFVNELVLVPGWEKGFDMVGTTVRDEKSDETYIKLLVGDKVDRYKESFLTFHNQSRVNGVISTYTASSLRNE